MFRLEYSHALLFTVFMTHGAAFERNIKFSKSYYDDICKNVTFEPFFENNLVVGKPWTIYYTWNIRMDEICLDMKFKYANKSTVTRMKPDVKALNIEPPWDKPVLSLAMSLPPDMILFKDRSGIPGRFVGVLDVVENRLNRKSLIKPHKMALKLLQNGQYLLMSDCSYGTTSLSLRKDYRPKRDDIESIAANFTFGDPFAACVYDRYPVK